MTKNIVSAVAVVVSAGTLLTGCNFEQPDAGCIVQDASFALWYAKYDLKEGQAISEQCEELVPLGEQIGVFKFTNPQEEGSAVLTIRPETLAFRGDRDPNENNPEQGVFAQTAVGKLSDETDSEDFCTTSEWVEAKVEAGPSKPGAVTAGGSFIQNEPATNISYQFSNVRVYAKPDAPGTQLTGDLTYSRTQEDVTCNVEFTVRAIWPSTPCDPDSNLPAENCGEGSGINPDFAVECDRVLEHCVPSEAIPSFVDED